MLSMNLSGNYLIIHLPQEITPQMLELKSKQGEKINSFQIREVSKGQFKLDTSNLSSGTYYIKSLSKDIYLNHKIVVSK